MGGARGGLGGPMSVRVLRVSGMPHNVGVWVDDRDDGAFIVYIDRDLITERGADALQSTLNAVILESERLDNHLVQATLRDVTS